jgi:hypothetical protein
MQKLKLGLAPTREDVLSLVNQTCGELGVKSYRFMIIPGDDGQGGLDYTNDWDPLRSKGSVNRDQVSLKDNHGAAEWVFTHPTIGEEELDMEYRVLISEFMREALQTALALGENSKTLELPSVIALPTKFVSSNALRRRHKINSPSAPPHVNFN